MFQKDVTEFNKQKGTLKESLSLTHQEIERWKKKKFRFQKSYLAKYIKREEVCSEFLSTSATKDTCSYSNQSISLSSLASVSLRTEPTKGWCTRTKLDTTQFHSTIVGLHALHWVVKNGRHPDEGNLFSCHHTHKGYTFPSFPLLISFVFPFVNSH